MAFASHPEVIHAQPLELQPKVEATEIPAPIQILKDSDAQLLQNLKQFDPSKDEGLALVVQGLTDIQDQAP